MTVLLPDAFVDGEPLPAASLNTICDAIRTIDETSDDAAMVALAAAQAAQTTATIAAAALVGLNPPVANQVNAPTFYGGATGVGVTYTVTGTDAAIGIVLQDKGGAGVVFASNSVQAFKAAAPALATNWVGVEANVTGGTPRLYSWGDANTGLALSPRGTGALSAHVPDSAAAGGNARGLNAVDWSTTRSTAAQVASGAQAVIGGGQSNSATGSNSTVSGGSTNVASSAGATVAGGTSNTAGGTNSWVPGGANGSARTDFGRAAWSAGQFTAAGDAQAGEFLLRRQSTSATAVQLTGNASTVGATTCIALPNLGTYLMRVMVVARQTGGAAGTVGDSAGWSFTMLVKRGAAAANIAFVAGQVQTSAAALAAIAATTAFAPTHSDAAAAAWRITVANDTTLGAVSITGTGEASKNINWVARISSVECVG